MDTGMGIPGAGLPSLDRVIQGVIPGDNIVWQIDLIGDYAVLVESFCDNALRNGRKLVYFRFARHPALLPADRGAAIRETTQLLLDIFRHGEKLYVHPLKVDKRHSPTMYLPHVWEQDDFLPVAESSVLADVLDGITSLRVDSASRTLDIWDRKFLQAQEVQEDIKRGTNPAGEAQELYRWLLRMAVTRDERITALASKYLDLPDILAIRKRMIGTGLIGGESGGMLPAPPPRTGTG